MQTHGARCAAGSLCPCRKQRVSYPVRVPFGSVELVSVACDARCARIATEAWAPYLDQLTRGMQS